jgi:four helix bundle protein
MEELDVFLQYENVADWVWNEVETWKPAHQETLGKQLRRAADSIGANLVEGDARYSYPESVHFFHIARGSARETRLWLKRAVRRKLVKKDDGDVQVTRLTEATKLLNKLITYRKSKLKRATNVSEERSSYQVDPFSQLLSDEAPASY